MKVIMRRELLTGTLSLLSWFQNHFILNPFCSNTLITLVLCFQIFWILESRDHIPDTYQLCLFSHFIFL